MDGYNDLGEPVNRFSQFGQNATTYMCTRTSDTGPEVKLMTFSDLSECFGNCVSVHIIDRSDKIQVVLDLGTFQIFEDQIKLETFYRYRNAYFCTSSPSSMPGATQEELITKDFFQWEQNQVEGTIRIDDTQYLNVDRVLDTILSNRTPGWQDQFMKMFILCTMVAHTRIEGFGGVGMLQYIGKTTPFNGLLFGVMEMGVEGLTTLTTRFRYMDHCDIACMVMNGQIINQTDLSGTGEMEGGLSFVIECLQNTWEGYVDYSNIIISETLPNEGNYVLTIGDSTWIMHHDYGNPGMFDLTDVLDPEPDNR